MYTNQRIQQVGSRAWGPDIRTVRNKLSRQGHWDQNLNHIASLFLYWSDHANTPCHVSGSYFPVCSNQMSEATSKGQGSCGSHSLIVHQAPSQGPPLGLVTVSTVSKGAYFSISIPCCQSDRDNEVLSSRTQRQPCIKHMPFFDPVSQILLFWCQGSNDRRPVSCRGWAGFVSTEDRSMFPPILGNG